MKSEIAWKEVAFELEKRDVQLLVLALVFVFERMRMAYGGLVGAVVSQSGQRHDLIREAMKAHTSLPSGILLAGGERDDCSSWGWLLLDKDCLWDCRIACRRELLRRVCCFLMPWGRFPTNDQLITGSTNPKHFTLILWYWRLPLFVFDV